MARGSNCVEGGRAAHGGLDQVCQIHKHARKAASFENVCFMTCLYKEGSWFGNGRPVFFPAAGNKVRIFLADPSKTEEKSIFFPSRHSYLVGFEAVAPESGHASRWLSAGNRVQLRDA